MYDFSQYKGGEPGIATLGIDGPYNVKGIAPTTSRRRIFVCRPSGVADEEPCARQILTTLARRAYRRPVTDEDVRTLVSFYRTGRREGGIESGIGLALERILAGPEFLFRIERDPATVAPGTPGSPSRLRDGVAAPYRISAFRCFASTSVVITDAMLASRSLPGPRRTVARSPALQSTAGSPARTRSRLSAGRPRFRSLTAGKSRS